MYAPEYRVCVRCMSPMIFVAGRWICIKCGFVLKMEDKVGRKKLTAVAQ